MSTTSSMDRRFLWRWMGANALAECLGLGGVGLLAWLLFARAGDGAWATLGRALAMVVLGAIEGWVVGAAQAHVLKERYPRLQGWVAATVAGAMAAWALGMLPSTLLKLHGAGAAAQAAPPETGEGLRLLLAAGLGMVAGPLLALFQWRRLRAEAGTAAWRWIPANAAAWALGMPIVFYGIHLAAARAAADYWGVAAIMAPTLLLAGAAVGAVHGLALLAWMPSAAAPLKSAGAGTRPGRTPPRRHPAP